MRRFILLTLLAAACDSPVRHLPDAKDIDAKMADAPADAHIGSAMHWTDGIDPNPSDNGLELGVFAISVVVAVGPLRARRRRKA